MSFISLSEVSKVYRMSQGLSVTALDRISLAVDRGEFVVITGRSGSGKTTLLNVVAGLTRPTSGVVTYDGRAVWELPDKEQSLFRNHTIGFVFQFPSLLPSLSVLENVLLPVAFGNREADGALTDRARELLADVGLENKLAALPRQLSAGQQQRVVIARALINQPDVLLADEPTSNLDEQTEHEIMALFQSIHLSSGLTVALVTHTRQLVGYGTRSVRMSGGAITASDEAPGVSME